MASAAATLTASQRPARSYWRRPENGWWRPPSELDQQLRAPVCRDNARVMLDLAGIERLDTAGAWLLLRTEARSE